MQCVGSGGGLLAPTHCCGWKTERIVITMCLVLAACILSFRGLFHMRHLFHFLSESRIFSFLTRAKWAVIPNPPVLFP